MSDDIFATLTPSNALTRLAFSDVYEVLLSRRQSNQDDGTKTVLGRMVVEPRQICDHEIVRLRREMDRTKYENDDEASDTLTEPDTDVEEQLRELGMVWVGHYVLGFDAGPAVPDMGWTAGKGPLENMAIDLLLCNRSFAQRHGINLRNPHAHFNFSPGNSGFYIKGGSRSHSALLTVNGDSPARQPYFLNQHSMKIQLGGMLEYCFQWTEFANQDDFRESRMLYMASAFKRPPTAL
ncbi:hypothetical protein E4U41_006464 [Claviceps citrina]|nr:hypothetical protein E4U41_006464 [Claviceps citrina]